MVKAVIHVELTEENGKQTVSVKADGNGLDLLDMTAQIAATLLRWARMTKTSLNAGSNISSWLRRTT